jgi:hypothetical protein
MLSDARIVHYVLKSAARQFSSLPGRRALAATLRTIRRTSPRAARLTLAEWSAEYLCAMPARAIDR